MGDWELGYASAQEIPISDAVAASSAFPPVFPPLRLDFPTRQMEGTARAILKELGLPDCFAGWTMVMLASAFWRDQVAAIPPKRRLCLLPHCLRHNEGFAFG